MMKNKLILLTLLFVTPAVFALNEFKVKRRDGSVLVEMKLESDAYGSITNSSLYDLVALETEIPVELLKIYSYEGEIRNNDEQLEPEMFNRTINLVMRNPYYRTKYF